MRDIDRLRLGLSSSTYDVVVEELDACPLCPHSYPLLCQHHDDTLEDLMADAEEA